MSETEKFTGKIQLRPRLENETDKAYFERVTGLEWEIVYSDGTGYSPDNLHEAIHDHDLSYFEVKYGNKGYICVNNDLYEIIELQERDIEESYCSLSRLDETTYEFEAQYYNGGCSLDEIIGDELDEIQ